MNLIWLILMAGGCVIALVTGRVDALMSSVLTGATDAVELMIGLAGSFCLWVGIEKLAEKSGLMEALSRITYPLFGRLFPFLRGKKKPLGTVAASVFSNILGLSSSTPLGLRAMREIKEVSINEKEAMDSMTRLVILNAAGFCIFPSSIIALRAAMGSNVPAIIAGPSAVAGVVATITGFLVHRILNKAFPDK
jgi:spore maturation protein A